MEEIWIFLLIIVLVIVFICLAAFVFFNTKTNVENFNLEVDITNSSETFSLNFEGDFIKIDWGDGNIESYSIRNQERVNIKHKYKSNGLYTVKGYNASNITYFGRNSPEAGSETSGKINTLHFTNFTTLQEISFVNENLKSIDITNLELLKLVGISSNLDLSSINLVNSSNLEEIYCSDTNISTLDLQYVPNLKSLYCYSTNISTLDLQYVPKIRFLYCAYLSFDETETDTILSQLVTNNQRDGIVDLTGNSPPSASGLISKDILDRRNWVVTVESE
jgi:hypothetical protein